VAKKVVPIREIRGKMIKMVKIKWHADLLRQFAIARVADFRKSNKRKSVQIFLIRLICGTIFQQNTSKIIRANSRNS
jgi:hypothetical protein